MASLFFKKKKSSTISKHETLKGPSCLDLLKPLIILTYGKYSSTPYLRVTFQDPQWMSETADNTEPCIYHSFYTYILTYDKV